MQDILSISPPPGPAPQPFQNNEMPTTDVLDTAERRMQLASLGPSSTDYAESLGNNQSITDLINDVTTLQAQGEDLLNNYGPIPNAPSPGGFNPQKGYEDLASKLNPTNRTLQATNTPMVVGTVSGYNRYKDSDNFQTFGYNEAFGSEQEYKYGRAMTWGDTVANAWGGGKALAANTFIEGWKGWGRMTEALFTWDASKLMGSQEERYQMAKEQEDLMNKYAIYDSETSKDSIWNRQFFGNMLQQSGFAIGAGLQFAMEEFLTMGAASFLQPALKGSMLARTAKNLETASELTNATRKVMNTVTQQAKVENAILKGLKTLTPAYKSVEELAKLHKAGAGFAQLAYTGLGGIRRGLSEFNMARSESIMEAASTYKHLQDRLVDEYTQQNGRAPEGEELERIKQTAENASRDNFVTNLGVLSVMNRIQYDNMFKSFSKTRSILSEGVKEFEGKAFQVSGKIAGKDATRVYQKGALGSFGSLGQISKEFGRKTAGWEATKSIGRGLMKFEGSEGVQELLQEASNEGLENYYYDLYHGAKGYGSKMDAVLSSIKDPITDIDGMKTFLMGALTGRLIAPMSAAFSGISTKIGDSRKLKADPNYKNGKQQVAETVGLLNKLYQDPAWFQKEAVASIKVNNKAAETMETAAANHNKYVFNNHKDSAFAKTVASAIKLNMYDSLRDSIKEFGSNMSDEEFKQAFGIDPTKNNKTNVKELANQMVAQVEDYYTTFNALKDEFGDKIVPELYKYNKPEDYLKAKLAKVSLDSAIEMIATNSYKAKQAIVRASQLQTEITANKNIGASSLEVLSKLGSMQALEAHISTLEREITDTLQAPGVILTKEQKEILRDKKDELRLATDWKKYYKDTMENDSEDYVPTPIGKAYETFAKLITLFNKRSKNTTAVSVLDVNENFIKLTDYIKLNRDNKEYVDAMNLLADPTNLELIFQQNVSAAEASKKKFLDEHLDNLTDDTGISTKELTKHEVVEAGDGTFVVKFKGEEVASGFATKEEAQAEADRLDVLTAENFAKEEETRTSMVVGKINIATTPPEQIINDLNKLSTLNDKLNWLKDNELIVPITIEGKQYNVVDYNDRVMVMMKIGKYNIPFYISTGTAGKKTVEAGKWYAIFGIGVERGWINKGSEEEINDQYGFVPFQKFAKILNEGVGTIVSREDNGNGKMKEGIGFFPQENDIIKQFNAQMNLPTEPAGRYDDSKAFYDHVNSTMELLNNEIGEITKAAIAAEESASEINTGRKPIVGDKLTSDSGKKYTIRGFTTDGGVQFELSAGGRGVWTKEQFEQYLKEGRLKYDEELDSSKQLTVDELIAKMNDAKSIEDLLNLYEDVENKYNAEDFDKIDNAYNKQYSKLELEEKAAILAGTKKVLSKDDPEFTKEYDLAQKQIADIANKPGVTVAQIEEAFKLMNAPLKKLDSATKSEFTKKLLELKESIVNKIQAKLRADDIASAKANITKSLSNPNVNIESAVNDLYDTLNITLKPEYKAEVIEHFEKEFTKVIDKKIKELSDLVNTGTSSATLTSLLKVSKTFREKININLEAFKTKTEKLREVKGTSSFTVPEIDGFETSTHRSIIDNDDTIVSVPQKQAIRGFVATGLLNESEVENIEGRHDASYEINRAVSRIYTLQINRAAKDFWKTGDSQDLKIILTKYYKERFGEFKDKKINADQKAKEEADYIIELKNDYDNASEYIIEGIQIPEVPEISKEQDKALSEYRSAIFDLMNDTAIVETLDTINKEHQRLILAGSNVTPSDLITSEIIKAFDSFIKFENGKKDREGFRNALVDAFDSVKDTKNIIEVNSIIQKILDNYIVAKKRLNGEGRGLLQSLFSSAIQTQNLIETEDDGAAPLTEEEMIVILDEPNRSLNKTQIAQIEEFAKTKQLPKYKNKFNAAVGYTSDPINFVPVNITNDITNSNFNSLRTKALEDKRTSEDLAAQLKPDADGKISTKAALSLIIGSEFATPEEKELARKLLPTISEEDFIVVDNSIKYSGEYDADEDKISINLDAIGFKEERPSAPVETVILHELMHRVIEEAIADPNSEYYKAIKELYNLVKKTESAKTFYAYQEGLTSDQQLHEFVTEAFTNPAFQRLLAKTPLNKLSNQSIWDRFMEVLSDILLNTFGVNMKDSVLAEVLSLTDGLYSSEETLDSDVVMDKIEFASTEEALAEIYKEIEESKSSFDENIYNKLIAAVQNKIDTVTGPKRFADAIKGLSTIKIGKTIYYYTDKTGNLQVFKKAKFKLSSVKKQDVIDKIKEEIAKRNPPPPGPAGAVNFTITSDLVNKDYKEDLDALDFKKVSEGLSKTAVEKSSLRSTSYDGTVDSEGLFVENEEFVKYYHKIRDIVNVLATQPLENLSGLYVSMVKDEAGFHWDGSAQSEEWNKIKDKGELGVLGYISDENGNPVVFDKEGKIIGKADRNNPSFSEYNTGENQIVYFNVIKKYTGGDRAVYDKLIAAREEVMKGNVQIAPLQKVSMGQMNLKSLVKPVSLNQKNTARDKELQEMLDQDHVNIELNGQFLNAVISDGKGGINRTALFPSMSKAVKITTPQGTYTMFDHLFELMKVYHELEDSDYSRIGDIKSKLVDFAYNMWLTGNDSKGNFRGLKIPMHFNSITIYVKDAEGKKLPVLMQLFTRENGVLTVNESNLKKVKSYMDNMKININKVWLDNGVFSFPYITEENGQKMISFEEKNYRDFLVKEAGLTTYINEIPLEQDIKRYNSIVHFLEPKALETKPSGVPPVSNQKLEENIDAIKNAVDKTIKNTSVNKNKKVRKTNTGRRFNAPSYDQIFEKICK